MLVYSKKRSKRSKRRRIGCGRMKKKGKRD